MKNMELQEMKVILMEMLLTGRDNETSLEKICQSFNEKKEYESFTSNMGKTLQEFLIDKILQELLVEQKIKQGWLEGFYIPTLEELQKDKEKLQKEQEEQNKEKEREKIDFVKIWLLRYAQKRSTIFDFDEACCNVLSFILEYQSKSSVYEFLEGDIFPEDDFRKERIGAMLIFNAATELIKENIFLKIEKTETKPFYYQLIQ